MRGTKYPIAGLLLSFFSLFGHLYVLNAQNSQPRMQGPTSGIQESSDFESVNLFNGKLNIKLPLVNVSSRGDTDVSVNLTIGHSWTIVGNWQTGYQVFPQSAALVNTGPAKFEMESVGFDWHETNPGTCGATEYEPSSASFSFNFTDSDGVSHILRNSSNWVITVPYCHPGTPGTNMGTEFVSWEGDGIKFVSDLPVYFNGSNVNMRSSPTSTPTPVSGHVMYPNGVRVRIQGLGSENIAWIEDRNGNRTTFSTIWDLPNQTYYRTITDAVGRQINIYFNQNEAPYGAHTKIIYKGTAGNERIIRVSGAHLWLPDGKQYNFYYNNYYEITKIETPLGSTIEYEYSGYVPSLPPPCCARPDTPFRRISERRVLEGGIIRQIRQFSYSNTSSNSETRVDTLDPNNNLISRTKHYFHGDPTPISSDEFTFAEAMAFEERRWNEGKEYSTESFAQDGTTILRKNETLWEPNGVVGTININARAASITSTLVDSGQVSRVVYGYDSNTTINLGTDVYEYDYGVGVPGNLIRRTHTEHEGAVSYTNSSVNLLSLPKESWISSDANGNSIVSRTKYEYDNYGTDANHASLEDRSNIIGHDSNYGTSFTTRGNVTKVTRYADAQNQTGAVSAYSQYDIAGNVIKVIDAKGNASTIDYSDRFGSPDGEARNNTAPSSLNGQATFAFATTRTNAVGYKTYSQFDYFTGTVVDGEDLIGNVNTTFHDDVLDRPTQTISANNRSQFRKQATVTCDDANRRVIVTGDSKAFGDNLVKSEAFYDGLGRTFETRTYESSSDYVRTLTEYDSLGRAYKSSTPHRPHLNEQPEWTISTFDTLDRVIQVKTPDNDIVSKSYSGTTTTVTDQAGRKRRGNSDAIGRLLKVIEDPNGLGYETNYTYDVLGRLRKTVQTEGITTQNRYFMYDDLGRLIRAKQTEQAVNLNLNVTDSVTGNTGWSLKNEYDANGNIISTTDANNRTITGIFDDLNRLTFRNYSDSTPDVTFTFDDINVAGSKGQLTSISTGVSKTSYTAFDELGRIKSSKQTTNGTEYNFPDYTYDFSGALVSQTYPSGRVVETETDNIGRLSKVTSQIPSQVERTYLSNLSYTPAGAVKHARLGNGRWESSQFDPKTLQTEEIRLGTSATDASLLKIEYDFGTTENNGSLRQQKITVPGAANPIIQNYTYDSLNRLQSATETLNSQVQWKQTFAYDRFGNRRFDATNTTTLAANNGIYNPQIDQTYNQFTIAEGYNYDAEGNITSNPENQLFTYDAENHQTQVQNTASQQTANYYYDGSGKRVRKVVGNEETVFVYDAFGKLVAEYSNVIDNRPKTTSYLTIDDLGSPRVVTDTFGKVIARHDYMPFGEEVLAGVGGRTTTQGYGGVDGVRKQFTGYERDVESGLDYAQARYFNPAHGRFTSVDPLAASANKKNPQTLNRYTYALNSPYKFTDPLGLSPCGLSGQTSGMSPGRTCNQSDDAKKEGTKNFNLLLAKYIFNRISQGYLDDTGGMTTTMFAVSSTNGSSSFNASLLTTGVLRYIGDFISDGRISDADSGGSPATLFKYSFILATHVLAFKNAVLAIERRIGKKVVFNEIFRDTARQKELRDSYEEQKKNYDNCLVWCSEPALADPVGDSTHQLGASFDIPINSRYEETERGIIVEEFNRGGFIRNIDSEPWHFTIRGIAELRTSNMPELRRQIQNAQQDYQNKIYQIFRKEK